MTNEEAHKFLEIKQREMTIKRHLYNEQAIEINGLAIEALEKQIPKKPTYTEIGNVYGAIIRTCAKCGDVCLISEDAKPFEHYCRYCGQALDWSDIE